ncbi:hypothetical protein BV898_00485 [Hypsibius exemplaris]|uniref:Vezatin n=1 Tax=Hypsibius exemplaris TaxID=2072580 RepID=A0A1W0XDJ6_HYPEX|nr:hypothetical protein BV898_00485 [Hypsibius exemplaris]
MAEIIFDPVIREILDSRRLIFEDETSIRHQLALSTRQHSPWFGSRQLAVCSVVFSAAGGYFYYNTGVRFLRNAPLVGRLFLAAGTASAVGSSAQEIARRRLFNRVREFLGLLRDASELSKRIARWILDNEVLQRGYAVTSHSLRDPNAPPQSGNVLSLKACLRLRRSAFIEARSMVFVMRAIAVDLLKSMSGGKDPDPLENHICLIPLEEFGDSLSISQDDLEALYLSTDGFSLQAVKSLTGLLDLQVSEFLKLLSTYRLTQVGCFADFSLTRRLGTAHTLFLEAFRRMEMEYQFETDDHLAVSSSLRRQSTVTGAGWNPPDCLRSLELHLTAALKDLRIVLTERRDGDEGREELQKVLQEDRLEKLGYHVKCSTMLLDHLKRRSIAAEQSSEDGQLSPTASDFEIRPVVTGDDELQIEDDIFEALVLGDAEAEHRGEPVFSELKHLEEQRHQSRMVIEEIKSVLSARSADWTEREQKVRERKGLPARQSSPGLDTPPLQTASSPILPADSIPQQASPEQISSAAEMANVAAALGSQWRSNTEAKFGSDDSDSGAE